MQYYAHTFSEDESRWQPLREHLRNVAELAKKFALEARPGDTSLAEAAYAAGLLHDLGKYRAEFQRMLRKLTVKGESTRHKQAGAARAATDKHLDAAFAILGHHGGIPDAADMAEGVNAGREVASSLAAAAAADCPELKALPRIAPVGCRGLEFDLRTRLLFSCLVDADWLDTSDFHARSRHFAIEKPSSVFDAPRLLANVLGYIGARAACGAGDTVKRVRAGVLAAALEAGSLPQGVFSLAVPTGGGKTLSSLAFALQHAVEHGLRRIIYVAPYLSIIEQNAAVFREALGPSSDGLILEHHSMSEPGGQGTGGAEGAEADAAQRLAENWDAPVVLTTSVQFYESLFSNQPGRCRKLHNVARSVVILDECQTLPPGYTAPTCRMLEQAAAYLACSIVLCTATQPAWQADPVRLPDGFSAVREIVPQSADLFRRLKRVEVSWPQTAATALSWDDVADLMLQHKQVLCVVNTRRAALEIYRQLHCKGCEAVHLSTNMCPEHRLRVLADVNETLKAGQPCRLVATQLVEAGVDLDFAVVLREMAPLDSIVQAAGRCNREGARKASSGAGGQVVVFRSRDGSMPKSSWYQNGAAVVEQDFLAAGRLPQIDSPGDITEYYRRLYATGNLDDKQIGIARSRLRCLKPLD